MATHDMVIEHKLIVNREIEVCHSDGSTFNTRQLDKKEEDLLISLLKEAASKPMGNLPKKEMKERKEMKKIAQNLLEEMGIYLDLGLVRIDLRRDSPYLF